MSNRRATGEVDVVAQVTQFDRTFGTLVVQDRGVGAYCTIEADATSGRPLQRGDWVRLRGSAKPGDFSPIIWVKSWEWQSRSPLPTPVVPTEAELAGAQVNNLWSSVRAKVLAIENTQKTDPPLLRLTLESPAGLRFRALWFGGRLEEGPALAGAEVEFTAVLGIDSNGSGQKMEPLILMDGIEQIRKQKAGQINWDAPKISLDQILTHGSAWHLGDRVRVEGVDGR
jgi:hypothetical protein